jgi:hypothetical protein
LVWQYTDDGVPAGSGMGDVVQEKSAVGLTAEHGPVMA